MKGLRRWGGYLALTIVFATACGLLSWWQWARRAEAVERVALVEANYDAAPVALETVLPRPGDADPTAEWRPVVLEGRYLVADQMLVRNRPHGGSAGFEVLVPFRTGSGRVFVVDRGWVPADDGDPGRPAAVPAPPEGDATIVVRLRPGEPEIPGRSAPEGQVATIHLPTIAHMVGGPVDTGMYGLLVSEVPAPAERPEPAARPATDEGPHLSYALQWIVFGILAIGGLVWAVRRERRIARGAPGRPARRTRGPTDAEVEDELLDRAGG